MKQEVIDYAKYQLEKSKDTLKDAELLYENNRLTSAVNRIYYAMFYSVSALMGLYGFSTSKHTGMLSNFNKEIANKGLIDPELKDLYYNMFDKRQKGDYDIYNFDKAEVSLWYLRAKDFIYRIEELTLKMIKESEPANKTTGIIKNNGNNRNIGNNGNTAGFTLIELVMTILLIGILSIGLYEVVMWGINDYLTNEQYLHSNNSMTYAMSVIRRNLENAAMPAGSLTATGGKCPLSSSNYPGNGQGNNNLPIILACQDGSAPSCSGNTACPVNGSCANPVSPSGVAFYQNVNGTTNQQLVVFCVNSNILYQEVTNTNGTTSYPVADNISGISF